MKSFLSCVTQPGHHPEYFSWWPPPHTDIHCHTHLHPSLPQPQRKLKPVVPYCLLIRIRHNSTPQFRVQYPGYQLLWVARLLRTSAHDCMDVFRMWKHQQKNSAPTHCQLPNSSATHSSHLPSAPVLSKASEHYSEILPRHCLAEREISISIIPLQGIHIC